MAMQTNLTTWLTNVMFHSSSTLCGSGKGGENNLELFLIIFNILNILLT